MSSTAEQYAEIFNQQLEFYKSNIIQLRNTAQAAKDAMYVAKTKNDFTTKQYPDVFNAVVKQIQALLPNDRVIQYTSSSAVNASMYAGNDIAALKKNVETTTKYYPSGDASFTAALNRVLGSANVPAFLESFWSSIQSLIDANQVFFQTYLANNTDYNSKLAAYNKAAAKLESFKTEIYKWIQSAQSYQTTFSNFPSYSDFIDNPENITTVKPIAPVVSQPLTPAPGTVSLSDLSSPHATNEMPNNDQILSAVAATQKIDQPVAPTAAKPNKLLYGAAAAAALLFMAKR